MAEINGIDVQASKSKEKRKGKNQEEPSPKDESGKNSLAHQSTLKSLFIKNRLDYIFWLLVIVFFIFLGAILTRSFSLFGGNVTAANYLLSTLAQSIAAIFAIAFSILIVVLQVTASKFTPAVFTYFISSMLKNKAVLASVFTFIGSLFFSIMTEAGINDSTSASDLQLPVSLCILLTLFCVLFIFLLFGSVTRLFNSQVTIANIEADLVRRKTSSSKYANSLAIILDITEREIIQGNIDTARTGLEAVGKSCEHRITTKGCSSTETEDVFPRLLELADTSFDVHRGDPIVGIVDLLKSICKASIDSGQFQCLQTGYLARIGIKAGEGEQIIYIGVLHSVLSALFSLLEYATEKPLEVQAECSAILWSITWLGSDYYNKAKGINIANEIASQLTHFVSKENMESWRNDFSVPSKQYDDLKAYFAYGDPKVIFTKFLDFVVSKYET